MVFLGGLVPEDMLALMVLLLLVLPLLLCPLGVGAGCELVWSLCLDMVIVLLENFCLRGAHLYYSMCFGKVYREFPKAHAFDDCNQRV